MGRLLFISLLVVAVIWSLNNLGSKRGRPFSGKLNAVLMVVGAVLIILSALSVLPRFGIQPLAFMQKVIPILGLI